MRLISWNIDSLNAALTGTSARAEMSRAVLAQIAQKKPDILAIQETKLRQEGPTRKHSQILEQYFPEYEFAFRSSEEPAKKGYAGTMFLYQKSLQPKVSYPTIGAPEPMDFEGRILTLEFNDFYVTQVYTPNSGSQLKRLGDRQIWDQKYCQYLKELDQKKPVLISGDFNVAHQEIDLAHPKTNHHSAGFTDEERLGFTNLLAAGFSDTFRKLNGSVPNVYTWWAQRVKTSKVNNSGWRIDYWLASDRLLPQVKESSMLDTGDRQDHTPIELVVDL